MTTVRRDPGIDRSVETLSTIEAAGRLGVPVWQLRRVLDDEGLARKVAAYRVILSIDLPAIRAALVRRGYLNGEAAKGGGVEGDGALEQAPPAKKEARRDVPSLRAPVVGSTAKAKTGRAVDRNPKRKGGPDRGNRN